MARDILSQYGKDVPKKMVARAKSGGIKKARDVWDYDPPQGPTSIGNSGPGLGGDNYGNCGTQGPKAATPREGGGAGLHGVRHPAGSQK